MATTKETDPVLQAKRDEFKALRFLTNKIRKDAPIVGRSGLRHLRDTINELLGVEEAQAMPATPTGERN